ncbi:MAG TPA: hypothetical protein VIO58_12250 [Candidatus Methanoperedens sp.]
MTLFVVLGSRFDTADDFDRVIDLARRLGVVIHPVLLTPLPGTELYEEYRPLSFKRQEMGVLYRGQCCL